MPKRLAALFGLICALQMVFAQEPDKFDFGKMWTFENPPTEWIRERYDLDLDQKWFDRARMSSLRFATWCSASFVSPDGLIMTNHHCSRDVVTSLQQEGEDFDREGFYAASLEDERRSPGLFVEQLVKAEEVTDQVEMLVGDVESDAERQAKTAEVLSQIEREYSNREDWQDLRLQMVTYYSGGRFSIYGYKRYDDIRLVFLPELALGFFGGDPDNFTYPRYNLDCTFWRAYDENGEPLNTSEHYFRFNPEGIGDSTPVFVIGNPGSTERYRTIAQLEYDRDYRYPIQLKWMSDRYTLMENQYNREPSPELKNTMFSFSNSIKAMTGIKKGLDNPELFGRKQAMEQLIRAKSDSDYAWNRLDELYEEISPYRAEYFILNPNPLYQGFNITMLHVLYQYLESARQNPDDPSLGELRSQIENFIPLLQTEEELKRFETVLNELQVFADAGDTYLQELLDDRPIIEYIAEIQDKTALLDDKKRAKLLDKPKKIAKAKDPYFALADVLISQYQKAANAFQETAAERSALEEDVANAAFQVYGDDLPPDATFTLRISDGITKGYSYNGTVAPWKTTYFGLYDRHFSHEMKGPWDLPERWQDPPMDLLKAPINIVSTNDIIGGNSGSPLINVNQEAVGLVFDGNIESLPGNFIFEEEYNRTVSVHAGGILAALRYIYRADRLLSELSGG